MKRYAVHLVAALITFSFGLAVSSFTSKLLLRKHSTATIAPANSLCTHDKIRVIQPRSNARLSIVEARCDKFAVRVVLAVENIGPTPITRLDIVMNQDYTHQKGIRSGQALNPSNGVALNVGETKTVTFSGVSEGVSCRRGTGVLQRSVFSIRGIEFADGSGWEEIKSSLLEH